MCSRGSDLAGCLNFRSCCRCLCRTECGRTSHGLRRGPAHRDSPQPVRIGVLVNKTGLPGFSSFSVENVGIYLHLFRYMGIIDIHCTVVMELFALDRCYFRSPRPIDCQFRPTGDDLTEIEYAYILLWFGNLDRLEHVRYLDWLNMLGYQFATRVISDRWRLPVAVVISGFRPSGFLRAS